jgi:hypothetical protein
MRGGGGDPAYNVKGTHAYPVCNQGFEDRPHAALAVTVIYLSAPALSVVIGVAFASWHGTTASWLCATLSPILIAGMLLTVVGVN